MQGRRWMEVGHGKGCRVCVGPKKTGEREGLEGACGRGGGGETQEEGWEGSRDGWRQDWGFKREGNASQRPGAPLGVLGWDGLSPELLGRLREVGTGLGTEGAQHSSCRDAGCGVTAGRLDNPAAGGLILQPGKKTSPRQQDPAEDTEQLPI